VTDAFGIPSQHVQDLHQRPAVLAAGQADHDAVAVFDEAVPGDGARHLPGDPRLERRSIRHEYQQSIAGPAGRRARQAGASGRRTATAVCKTNVKLSLITYEGFEQLYFQNPEFGLYLVRLIVRRFNLNLTRAEETLRLREVELLDRLLMYEPEVSLPTGVDAGRNAIEVARAKHQDILS